MYSIILSIQKPKVDLEDVEITPQIKQKLTDLQQKYDIFSKHSSNIGITHLEEMRINTDPNLPPVANNETPYHLDEHSIIYRKSRDGSNIFHAIMAPNTFQPYI